MSISRYLSIFADFLNSSGVLGISGGGTGLTSTPSNGQLDIGNGTGFTRATISAGTGISVTNGAGTISIASSATSPQVYSQLFTASGTWTAPTGVTRVRVWCVGAGAGGSLYTGACGGLAYGGAGGVSVGVYTVSPGTGYTVTVGAGGAGVSNTTGGSGGTTSFGGVISATGGSGGNSAGGTLTNGSSGAGSSGTVYNSSVVSGGQAAYIPASIGPVNMSTALYAYAPTATAVAASGQYGAGNGGSGSNPPSKGGVGGIIYLEWNQ